MTQGVQDTVGLYALSQQDLDFAQTVAQIVKDRVAPRAAEIDATGLYPSDIRQLFSEHDIFGLPFDVEYGGTGTGTLTLNLAIAEIAKACASSALMLMLQSLASLPIQLFGTADQKQRWLPRLATGEWVPALALSEAEAGSDPGAMRTRAHRDGSGWVINGSKHWISNASIADLYVVFAVTDASRGHSRGISAFVVESDRPGFSVGKLERKLGIRGVPTGQLSFDDVCIPEENLIGCADDGFRVALATLDRSRLGVAAQALGIAEGATDYAADYARQRRQFGMPINSFQAIQFKLADMATRCHAARELLCQASAKVDRLESDIGKYSAMAKLFCSDAAMDATVEAVQILGGYGYVSDYPVERLMRDAKICQIYEGTNEIQRIVIGRSIS